MRHLWETMSGSGDSGTGTKPTPCHIHTHPTTSHTPHAQQAPRPRPRLFCPHSPICTQPTGTSRCPAPTRHLSLVPHPIYPNHQNPPRHIPAKRTQPAQPHPPRDQPRPSYPTGTPASHPPHSCAQNADHLAQNTPHSPNFTEVVCTLGTSIPNTVRSARIRQTARNPRIRHAARPTSDAPASHPHHSCAQNADHLAQNTPHSPNFTEVVCALGAHRTIGSTSKETQWMRIRSTPLRRTHTPPQVRTTLSAVDSLGVLSWASW